MMIFLTFLFIIAMILVIILVISCRFTSNANYIAFGYRKYYLTEIKTYNFQISVFRAYFRHRVYGWKVRVDVYNADMYIRTHILDASSQKSANKTAKEISEEIENKKQMV